MAKPFNDIDAQSLDDLIKRVIEAKENNLALSADDYQLLLDALLTLTTTQNTFLNMDSKLLKHYISHFNHTKKHEKSKNFAVSY